jgi:hypothetical protein
MIPQFNLQGNLPQGIYVCTWEEFTARFGITSYRLNLINGLKTAMISLKDAGCSVIYVDGSFVTSKPSPGDFDACWDTDGVDIIKLQSIAPNLLNFKNKRAAQKSQYKGEFFLADQSANQAGMIFLDFFQLDRDGNPKGIIAIDLGSWEYD